MKTNHFKIITSIITVWIAIGSSLMMYSFENKIATLVTGYIMVPPEMCLPITLCDTSVSSGRICTAVYQGQVYQVYRKISPSDTFCPIICFCPN